MEFRGLNVKQKQISLSISAKEIQKLKPQNVDSIGGEGEFQLFEDFRFSKRTLEPDPLKIER